MTRPVVVLYNGGYGVAISAKDTQTVESLAKGSFRWWVDGQRIAGSDTLGQHWSCSVFRCDTGNPISISATDVRGGSAFSLKVDPVVDTLADLQKEIEFTMKIPESAQILFVGCKSLAGTNPNLALKEVGITTTTTTQIAVLRRLDDVEEKKKTQVAPDAWYRLSAGLNVEGLCEDIKCKAFGEKVIDPIGFTSSSSGFNTQGGKAACPMCLTRIHPTKLLFVGCSYRFINQKSSSEWQTCPATGTTFSLAYSGGGNPLIVHTATTDDGAKEQASKHTCAACGMGVRSTEQRYFLKMCGHWLHKDCVGEWFAKADYCPANNCKVKNSAALLLI